MTFDLATLPAPVPLPIEADVVVVGAGLAGLAAAAVASRAGRRVHVLDTRSPGGRARTDEKDGFRLNQGAHALYRSGEGRAVLARLGIRPTGGAPLTGRGRIRRGGVLAPIPDSPGRLLRSPLLGARAKVQAAKLLGTLPRVTAADHAGVSFAAWLDDAGLHPAGRALVEMTSRIATYRHDLATISADAVIQQLQRALGDGVEYLDEGWGSLVAGLLRATVRAGGTWSADAAAVAVSERGARWQVATRDAAVTAPTVVIAAGGPVATRSLLPADPGWDELGTDSEVACLDLGVRNLPEPPVLLDLDEPLYLSTHCPPARLAPEGGRVVHLLRYGVRNSDEDRADLWALAAAAGIGEADVVTGRFLHRMVASHAVPRPGAGLAGRPPVAVQSCPGVFVAGDWVGPRGLLADAALGSGEAAAHAAVGELSGAGRAFSGAAS